MPTRFVIDGSNLAKLRGGPASDLPDLNQVLSARDDLAKRFPGSKVVVCFDGSDLFRKRDKRFLEEHWQRFVADLRAAAHSSGFSIGPSRVVGPADAYFLEKAQAADAAVVTDDGLGDMVDQFPWLNSSGRLFRPRYEIALGVWTFHEARPRKIQRKQAAPKMAASKLAGRPDAREKSSTRRVFATEEDGVGLAIGGVQDHHLETFRVTSGGRVEHRWYPDDTGGWSDWHDFGFEKSARDVAVTSGWPGDHLELFILARDGAVWHRWWWKEIGWNKEEFVPLGTPFMPSEKQPQAIAAASQRRGHMEVQVRATDGSIRNIWFREETKRWQPFADDNSWNDFASAAG